MQGNGQDQVECANIKVVKFKTRQQAGQSGADSEIASVFKFVDCVKDDAFIRTDGAGLIVIRLFSKATATQMVDCR